MFLILPPKAKTLVPLDFSVPIEPVSYTHLDVYKRQVQGELTGIAKISMEVFEKMLEYFDGKMCIRDRFADTFVVGNLSVFIERHIKIAAN